MTEFTADVCEKLKHYVYRLIDPRDGSTFYIGRGKDNRVFDHVKGALKVADHETENLRLATILKILGLGLEPMHVIHRHGMSPGEAQLVEAALIDAYPGLTNIAAGEGSNDYGPANADQLVELYGAEEINFDQNYKIMVIKTKWLTVEERGGVYEAVRSKWKVSKTKADKADYVLAIIDGICRGVYIPKVWKEHLPRLDGKPRRYEFDGNKAEKGMRERYVGKRIPDRMKKKGMASPVLYEGY